MTAFQTALKAAMESSKAQAKRDGITSMGIDNWKQITRTPSGSLDGAPRGTNAEYYYAEMFREMAAKDSFAY